jgi:hypothetical protein
VAFNARILHKSFVPSASTLLLLSCSFFECCINTGGHNSLLKGTAANILRGVAGAGVLSLYDKLQQVLFGKVYSGGM